MDLNHRNEYCCTKILLVLSFFANPPHLRFPSRKSQHPQPYRSLRLATKVAAKAKAPAPKPKAEPKEKAKAAAKAPSRKRNADEASAASTKRPK